MSDQIKNRVVGAIVLFALAVVFIPKIFDGEKESQRREFIAIPKKPIHQPPRVNIQSNGESTSTESIQTESTVSISTKKIAPSQLDTESSVNVAKISKEINKKPDVIKPVNTKPVEIKAKAWVIRMGTFGNPDNVNALVKKLRTKGFSAFSVPRVPKAGLSNKVFIGPELNQNVLVKFQPQLKREFKESGVIEIYSPLQ